MTTLHLQQRLNNKRCVLYTASGHAKNNLLLYVANYNLLNIDRVISEVEVRKRQEADTIHRRFTGALLLG